MANISWWCFNTLRSVFHEHFLGNKLLFLLIFQIISTIFYILILSFQTPKRNFFQLENIFLKCGIWLFALITLPKFFTFMAWQISAMFCLCNIRYNGVLRHGMMLRNWKLSRLYKIANLTFLIKILFLSFVCGFIKFDISNQNTFSWAFHLQFIHRMQQ